NEAYECYLWMKDILQTEIVIGIPEIANYEIRRELIRVNKTTSLSSLNALKTVLRYFPITTPVMLKAAEFWAKGRNQGTPTAHPEALDCDVIIAAQADVLENAGYDVTVVTTNARHISLFVKASHWREIE